MFKRKLFLSILIFILSFSLIACNSNENDKSRENSNFEQNSEKTDISKTTYPLTFKDSYDREVTLKEEPKRVISIAPNITETIYALGSEDKLVGRSEYGDYPLNVSNVESVGSITEPSIEKIAELKPDLVIASTHFKKEVVEKIESLGINVAIFYGRENFEGVYDTIENIGLVLNVQEKADSVITDMKNTVDRVNKKVSDLPKKSTYYVVGFGEGGDFTAGGDTFIGEMIEMAGGDNSASDVKGWSYSLEKLIENDPEILIMTDRMGEKEKLIDANGYSDLTAVKKEQVYVIDENILNRQGPRLSQGLLELAKIIHPDAFK